MTMISYYRDAATQRWTIRITKWFGISAERMQGSDRKWYLAFVAWAPRNRRTLRHFYWSIRSI